MAVASSCGAATIDGRDDPALPSTYLAAAAIGVAAAAPSAHGPPVAPPAPSASTARRAVGRRRVAGCRRRRPWPEPDARRQRPEPGSLQPDLVLLGSWTVAYVVGPENGDGANIEIPLRHLDGLVIKPGATFDFWRAVGEVSRGTGYRRGAIIVGNQIDPDGALAGGICTVSTALFDAAARAGLQIVSRTSHGGYLEKYQLGLDAAVAKGDGPPDPGVPQRHPRADRDPDRRHAGDRKGRPVREHRARSSGHVQPAHDQPSAARA